MPGLSLKACLAPPLSVRHCSPTKSRGANKISDTRIVEHSVGVSLRARAKAGQLGDKWSAGGTSG